MKLSTKLIVGFAAVSLIPLTVMTILLYVYVSGNNENINIKTSQMAESSFQSYIADQFAALEKHASDLSTDKDFLINVLDLPKRESDLTNLLQQQIESGEFQFALIRLTSTQAVFKACQDGLTPMVQAYHLPAATANSASSSGIIKLSSQQNSSLALVETVPIPFRSAIVGELMIGKMLPEVVSNYRLSSSGLKGVLVTEQSELIAADVSDTTFEPILAQLVELNSQQPLWQASLGNLSCFVRQSDLKGLDGKSVATVRYVLDQSEFLQSKKQLLHVFVSIVALALLLSLALGFFLSRSIAKPVVELSSAAKEIASGRVPQRINYPGGDEIGDLVAGMNRLTDDLRETEIRLRRSEQVAAWQMFARQTAHELKNFLMPLATTISRIQRNVLAEEIDREILTQSVNELHHELQRMKNLLTAFSEFARMPAPKFQRISAATLIGDIKSTFAEQILSGHLSISAHDERSTLKCDPDQIGQVLLNLITNSFEANASTVDLKLDTSDERVIFEVTDDGEGINLGYELDPFTPLLTTKPQGSGLGLAICRRIVTDHGGDISFAPNPTGGTVFTFYIPKEVT